MAESNKKITFLDVDSSIVEKNLRFANETEDEFNKLFENASDNMPSKVVKPTPGFCVKTREVGTDTKVFVNICCTDAIPPPKDISESELQKILDEEDNQFKVPMSIGQIRTEKDKKGQEAKACDIAIHPAFFKKLKDIQLFKTFFMTVAFHGLENKYSLVCNDEKIILNNRKAFGTLQVHRIQQREIDEKMRNHGKETQLIEELVGKESIEGAKIEVVSSNEQTTREPEYVLYKKTSGQNYLFGEFKFPDIISAKELSLAIGEDRILVEAKNRGYLLDVFIPYIVRQEKCTSSFEKTTKILTVTMPLVGG